MINRLGPDNAELWADHYQAMEEQEQRSRRTREDNLRVDLYNAAVEYAAYISGEASDYDKAMAVAKKLEDAADAFSERSV
jgi:hypothetical protein